MDDLATALRAGKFFHRVNAVYLIGAYNAGPKSALILQVAVIRAGVKRAGVIRAVFQSKFSKSGVNFQILYFFQLFEIT